ncbi:MAG: 3-deoxy-7-phosphoheptulonate synthase [Planctomycetota bacterium]|nr:MAG: 3-deoxy-7-phosphoheptulonate synthase [Planctomycetota bacterium]
MLVVMQAGADAAQVENVVAAIRELGLTPHPLPGATRTAIGITGNTGAIEPERLQALSGVLELIRVTKPFKLASREMHPEDTVVRAAQTAIGPGTFTIIAGPCSVEGEDLILRTADFLVSRGVRMLRAGAFKPRSSPYSFQGLEFAGLDILAKAREKTGIGIVTELMDAAHADAVEQAADVLQIGTRNMQNFSLLKRVAVSKRPVLLKRGLAATLEEWLMAAEYVLAGGNYQVALCERGVRTFADHSRNTLDLSVIPPAKLLSHLPVLVDPSHGTGRRAFVPAMAMAALAAGADGLLIEIHPEPDKAWSDGAQTLDFDEFDKLLASLRRMAEVMGREIN